MLDCWPAAAALPLAAFGAFGTLGAGFASNTAFRAAKPTAIVNIGEIVSR